MGSTWFTGGVVAAPRGSIQFDFIFNGIRYRPSIKRPPFDAYLVHCEARLRRNDMAAATVRSYRKILDGVWRPHLGDMIFSHIRYSRLITIADGYSWSKKTYNNAISVLKRAFDFGYRDRSVYENPALNLRCARLRKSDRPKVDPFSMHDAETLMPSITIGEKPKATTMNFAFSQG